MKKILVVMVGLVFLGSCVSNKPVVVDTPVETNKTTEVQVEPEVKEPTVEVPVVKPPVTRQITSWKLQEISNYYPDGFISGQIKYTLDAQGLIAKEEVFNANNVLATQKTFTTLPNGSVEILTLNGAREVLGRTLRELQNGRPIRETLFNAKNEQQGVEEFSYDAQGNRILWTVRTATGNQTSTNYTYVDGRLTGLEVRDSAGAIIKSYKKIYDASGLLIRDEEYDNKGTLLSKKIFEYAQGKLIAEINQNAAGAVQGRIAHTVDSNGNIVESQFFDRRDRLTEKRVQIWKAFVTTITE